MTASKRLLQLAALMLALALPARAQGEAELQKFFEGKFVTMKMDMPATQLGVEVYPQREQPLDLNTYSDRLKSFGAALKRGDSVMITKVKVKDKHIEFQLGGGGYGTARDERPQPVQAEVTPKSQSELDLEERLRRVTNPYEQDRLQRRLDRLRRDRERQDQQNKADAAQATEANEERIAAKRLQAGSRFNLRYEPKLPPEALTPQSVMDALAEYLTFSFKVREEQ